MIAFALKPFLPVIGGALLVGGAWWYHADAVNDAYKRGVAEITAKWQEADRLAVAVGDEKSRLLKRGAATVEGDLNAKLKTLADRDAARSRDTASLRTLIDELAATPPSGSDPGPACRSYESEYRGCARLLGEGVELVGEGQRLVEDSEAKLGALRDWARLVVEEP